MKKGAQGGGNEMSVRRTNPFHLRSKFVTSRPVNRAPKERQRGDAAGGTRGRRPLREVPSARPAGRTIDIVELLALGHLGGG